MSMKIYDGLRSDILQSTSDLFGFMSKLKTKLTKTIVKANCEIISLTAVKQYDEACFNGGDKTGVLLRVFDEVWARSDKVKTTKMRDPEIDYSVTISFAAVDQCVLAIPCCEHDLLLNTIRRIKIGNHQVFNAYPYWNNSDKSPDVSQKEWDRRGVMWSKFSNSARLLFECGVDFLMPKVELINPSIMTLEERSKRIAADIAIQQFVVARKEPARLVIGDAFRYIASDEGTAEVLEIATTQVMPKLESVITLDDLR